MNLDQRAASTPSETPHLSLTPVLSRMALGLLCVLSAAFLFKKALELPPELQIIETPVSIKRDGLQQDDIRSATLRFEGNHPMIQLSALPKQNTQDVLRGQVTHQVQNKMVVRQSSQPQNHDLQATLTLNIKPSKKFVVIGRHHHIIDAKLSPFLPLNLWIKNQWGGQRIDLSHLEVKQLAVETVAGHVNVKLPQKDIEKLVILSRAGHIKIDGQEKIKIKKVSLKNRSKAINASLENIDFESLNIGNESGKTDLRIGGMVKSAEVSSERGEMDIYLFKGARGKMSVHNKEGEVNLFIDRDVHIHLKLPGKEPLVLPKNAQGKPDLEVYVNALDGYFKYQVR